ncbi:MAG: hypothetical protein MI866_20780 [Bacteroidales bacterium]|nr:hypothetical protein [Bacteroidales bacterium]
MSKSEKIIPEDEKILELMKKREEQTSALKSLLEKLNENNKKIISREKKRS